MSETKANIERLLSHLKGGSLAHKLASSATGDPTPDQLTANLKKTLADRVVEIRNMFDDRDD